MRRGLIIAAAVVVALALFAGAAFGGVAAGRLVAGPEQRPRVDRQTGLTWRACAEANLRQAGAECTTVTVPLDWSKPDGPQKVRLAISRVEHTGSRYAGVILANPGGPGGSGLRLATLGSQVPDGVGDQYDWIGFDPRGVGDSTPRLSCDSDYANGPRPRYTPASDDVIEAWMKRSAQYAQDCTANGDLLDHMKTEDLARDMDAIRAALGAKTISYFGYSYGTYLGQVYATMFPTRLHRMVLDSTVDPAGVWYQANLDQDVAFETAIDAWFAWIAEYDDTYGLGSSAAAVRKRFVAQGEALDKDPAQGVYGQAEWSDTFLYAGYGQSLWPGLAAAFQGATEGDYGQAISYWKGLNEVTDDNGYAAYLATECTDAPWPKDWATWQRDTERIDEQAPLGTWLNTWFNAPCRTWPAASGTPVEIDGSKTGPILMIDETLDAATPYAGSLAVRKLFPKARLIAEPGGTSHATSLSGNSCVDDAIAAYLGDDVLPQRKDGEGPDATCAPLPRPTP